MHQINDHAKSHHAGWAVALIPIKKDSEIDDSTYQNIFMSQGRVLPFLTYTQPDNFEQKKRQLEEGKAVEVLYGKNRQNVEYVEGQG